MRLNYSSFNVFEDDSTIDHVKRGILELLFISELAYILNLFDRSPLGGARTTAAVANPAPTDSDAFSPLGLKKMENIL